MKYDYLIVGSGLTGATLARLLMDQGKSVLVVEQRNEVGGNIATEVKDGIVLHKYGPHIFHTSDLRAWEFFNKYVEVYSYVNTPMAFYKGKYYNMPFNMNTFHQLFGVTTPEEAKAVLEKEIQAEGIQEPKNLEEQALSLVGRTIYETLIHGYTQKQWGRKCSELPASIIKRLPLRFEYNNNYFNDLYQGQPKGGYTPFIEHLLEGAEVRLGVDYLERRKELDALAKKTIYTGRLDLLFGCDQGALEWRSLRFETRKENVDSFQPVAVVNYTDSTPAYTRITEHKKFDPDCPNHESTIISEEYPDSFKEGKIPYYTINDEKNTALASAYKKRAEAEGILLAGRLATYRYLDMDDAILEAMDLAAKL